ncbi:MAG: ABC transporter substrate-binding protein [Alistipes sp.]|nr:ABC transporter substrate-binding protein [Alistipes sp.]
MKHCVNILLLLIISWVSVCCGVAGGSKTDLFTTLDYAPSKATGFAIFADADGNKLLRVTRPWQGESPVEQTLAIFQSEEAAAGYSGQAIVGPAKRVVCMSTSYVAMLDALGLTDAIVGVSGKQYVTNERVRTNPEVRDVGYDSSLDFEAMLLLDADLVILYGVSAENSAVTSKLREIGVPYIYLGDYTEQSPLGKAEWVVAIAEIMGRRERGEELFNSIAERYEAVKASVPRAGKAKSVMFNLPYQDVWYMPSDDSYMVQLIEDAGGEYIYKGKNTTSSSCGISLEEAISLVSRADVWLNVGQCSTISEVRSSAPLFAEMDVVLRGEVYNNNRRRGEGGGSDFWESAIVRPDVVLQDLVNILSGSGEELYYHHKLK